MSITPIETKYKGYRFRSRLEARWAVQLDAWGIKWEYEYQGYKVADRLNVYSWDWGAAKQFHYLPDFWFPDLRLHAEVKGELDEQATKRLLTAAAYLSNPGGGCVSSENEIIVLGPLNNDGHVPLQLHFHEGDLEGCCFLCANTSPYGYSCAGWNKEGSNVFWLGNDNGELSPWASEAVLNGVECRKHSPISLDAGRSARFEWGKSGA